MPPTNRFLRPTRSATRPKRSVNPAAASAKDVAIHWRWASEKPSPSPTTGRATFRIEKSTAIMNWEPSSSASTSFWRPVIRGAVRGAVFAPAAGADAASEVVAGAAPGVVLDEGMASTPSWQGSSKRFYGSVRVGSP